MKIPYWLFRLLPMWGFLCPRCRQEVKKNSHQCPHCGEKFPFPLRVPPMILKDKKIFEEYVHREIFPKVSASQREYLTQFFTVIFTDGFETGDFSKWDSIVGSPEISSTSKTGIYSMKMDASQEYVTKNFTGMNEVYWRWYVRYDVMPDSDGDYMRYCGLEGSGGVPTRIVNVELINQTGNMKICLGENFPSSVVYSDTITIGTGEWHCIEIRFKKDINGGYQVWFDGVLVLSDMGKDTSAAGAADELRLGYGVDSGGPYTLYIDSVTISDTYIGPEPGPHLYFRSS